MRTGAKGIYRVESSFSAVRQSATSAHPPAPPTTRATPTASATTTPSVLPAALVAPLVGLDPALCVGATLPVACPEPEKLVLPLVELAGGSDESEVVGMTVEGTTDSVPLVVDGPEGAAEVAGGGERTCGDRGNGSQRSLREKGANEAHLRDDGREQAVHGPRRVVRVPPHVLRHGPLAHGQRQVGLVRDKRVGDTVGRRVHKAVRLWRGNDRAEEGLRVEQRDARFRIYGREGVDEV